MPRKKKSPPPPTGPVLTEEMLLETAGPRTCGRANEYACSDLIRARIVSDDTLFARIFGNYGVYQTCLTVDESGKMFADCTCPADMIFCKHAVALGLTWIAESDTFFDLGSLEGQLQEKSKVELIALIREMAESYPEVLGILEIEGFEDIGEDEEGEEW